MPGSVTQEEILALVAVSRFGACATSREGIVVFWNRRAEQILGWPAAHVIGRRYDEVIDTTASPSRRGGHASAPAPLTGDAAGPLTASMWSASGEHVQIALTPVVVADQPDDETLTLYLFDAPTDARTPPPGDHHTPALAPAGPDAVPLPADHPPHPPVPRALSRRELQILRLVAAGTSTDQIASDLRISVHTVRNHIRSLRRKLDAKTKLAAVVTAMRDGLI